jgi:hypothetical protein
MIKERMIRKGTIKDRKKELPEKKHEEPKKVAVAAGKTRKPSRKGAKIEPAAEEEAD